MTCHTFCARWTKCSLKAYVIIIFLLKNYAAEGRGCALCNEQCIKRYVPRGCSSIFSKKSLWRRQVGRNGYIPRPSLHNNIICKWMFETLPKGNILCNFGRIWMWIRKVTHTSLLCGCGKRSRRNVGAMFPNVEKKPPMLCSPIIVDPLYFIFKPLILIFLHLENKTSSKKVCLLSGNYNSA